MTEQKITEYCNKVVHSNAEDAVKYIFVVVVGGGSHSEKEGYAQQWLSARKSKLCSEQPRCGNLFLYVAGAASSMYDGQNIPAAPFV